jgi:hypothetical protein
MVKVLFKRSEYSGECEKCKYFVRKFDDKQKYPKTVLIICRIDRHFHNCPLIDRLEPMEG